MSSVTDSNGNGGKIRNGRKKRDDPTIKRRTTRACDQCRKTKSKCARVGDGNTCQSCLDQGLDCSTSGPSLKRGPPKGYLHTVEGRLHEVEALLGILLSIPDNRAVTVLADIAEDPFARQIIERVNHSAFGPLGRMHSPAPNQSASSSDAGNGVNGSNGVVNGDSDPFVNGPTNEWQDQIIAKFTSGCSQYGLQPFGTSQDLAGVPPIVAYQASGTSVEALTDYSESEDDALALGQLTLDENEQVRFNGKSSGLHLLDQSARTDDIKEGGLWRLKDNHAEGPVQLQEDELQLPSMDEQLHLLNVFFDFTYPSFPIIDKAYFMQKFKSRVDETQNDEALFRLLLLSMFSLAARHSPRYSSPDGNAGTEFFDKAKSILNRIYHISHPTTCQATLLLALREFGMAAMGQAWLYVGMAIRMAQDLGMHRTPDQWTRGGKLLFNPHEVQVRKRIWYGCVQEDKYISMYMGRPVTIHEQAFDTFLPNDVDDQEYEIWHPCSVQMSLNHYNPIQGRLISCWNANTALSIIVCRTMERLYTPNNEKSAISLWSEALKLKQQLVTWMQALPSHLQLNSVEEMKKAPPHFLTLHMQWECAMIVLHLRFVRLPKGKTDKMNPVSQLALESAIQAALRINALATVYRSNFGLKMATPFYCYDIFSAGTIWVAALNLNPNDMLHSQRLEACIQWLDELQNVWSCAERSYKLLKGVVVAPSSSQTNNETSTHDSVMANTSMPITNGVGNFDFPDFNLPSRDMHFSGLDGQQDFMISNETPWDSPFDIFIPPSNLADPQSGIDPANIVLRNPYNAHMTLFDGFGDFTPSTSTNTTNNSGSNGTSGSASQADSSMKSTPVDHQAPSCQPPYM